MAFSMLNRSLIRGFSRFMVTSQSHQLQFVPKYGQSLSYFTRSLSHFNSNNKVTLSKHLESNTLCKCGCRCMHTKGDQELVQFLLEEINAEVNSQKHPSLPKIEHFEVKTTGSEVVLTKKFNDEKIKVVLNVNHSVNASESGESPTAPKEDKPESTEMKSKPSFTVEIEKNGNTIGFTCSYVEDYAPADDASDPDAFNDNFNIDEIVFHQGEWNEKTYSVSGDIIDGYLYDLLMNTLEERGISNEFAEKLSEFCTSYEHKLYIKLLESLKAFVGSSK
uniref:Complement component 1 Q subcomponent-binding protein, mitochondrial n=1 Tax=Strigamia maritima TaxID=126957 RepID=T1J6E2_STRMM